MPNFLKSLFKLPSASRRSQHPSAAAQSLPPAEGSLPPNGGRSQIPEEDLDALADLLRRDLQVADGAGDETTMRRMLGALDRMREERHVTPFLMGNEGIAGGEDVERGEDARGEGGGRWSGIVGACDEALAAAYKVRGGPAGLLPECQKLLGRIISLLEAQRAELGDLRVHAGMATPPTLKTLQEIYAKLLPALTDIQHKSPDAEEERIGALETLVRVLEEGPDYLLDVALIEAIIWQAEVVDPGFGAEIRRVLDKAVSEQSDLFTFRRAAESIIAVSSGVPPDVLDDDEGKEAYTSIGRLVKQLQDRVNSSSQAAPSPSLSPASSLQSPRLSAENPSASASPSPSTRAPSPIESDPNFETLKSASDLEARYGTGVKGLSSLPPSYAPAPTPAATPSRTPTAPPSPSPSATSEVSEEVWEYKGNLLTRSALSLVLRQEALAMADSSGQYAGEVSWDDLRNAWIPVWAEKLRPGDLAEGEVPDTNPAGFRMRRRDQWGNRIGWRDGRMFYADEPSFELPD